MTSAFALLQVQLAASVTKFKLARAQLVYGELFSIVTVIQCIRGRVLKMICHSRDNSFENPNPDANTVIGYSALQLN